MKKFIKISVLILILAVFVLTIVYLYRKSQVKPVVYQTEKPFITNITVRPLPQAQSSQEGNRDKPQVSGIVEEVLCWQERKYDRGISLQG